MTCSKCNHNNIEKVISVTNSSYFYCSSCKNGKEIALKNLTLDSIYKEIYNFFINSKKNYIKVEVKKINKKLHLIINNLEVYCTDFTYSFSKMDTYFIENIIHDLVDDLLHLNTCSVDILVCL